MGLVNPEGRPLRAIATGQRENFSRRQANADGVTNAMLRSRTQSGHLDQVGVRTFASSYRKATPLGDLHALLMDIGDPVWACGPTAAALHGFDGYRSRHHSIWSPCATATCAVSAISCAASLELIDRCIVQDLAATSPTRTIDLARTDPNGAITAAIDSAIRDLGTSEDFLHRRIAALRSSGRFGIPRLLAIIDGCEASRGGQSWLERRFLEMISEAGLPRPQTQVVMSKARNKLIRVDCWFPEQQVVVELLGYRWHRTELQMVRDVERMNRLALEGVAVVQFTYSHVAGAPDYLLETLCDAGIEP